MAWLCRTSAPPVISVLVTELQQRRVCGAEEFSQPKDLA
jgi:hypothetical protein